MKKHHVICIQEHWLFGYEKHRLSSFFPSWMHHARSQDVEDEDISSLQKAAAAHVGLATMWKPELDPYVTRTDEGNSRILLTTFDIPGNHLCIINCYLPSGTSPQAISKYREDVDVLYELTV